MDSKWIGFDRKLEPEWLDFLAVEVLKDKAETEIRKELLEYLSSFLKGKEAISKTVTVMTRLWFSGHDEVFMKKARELLTQIDSPDSIWIYWGLILLTYPFMKDIAEITGRLLNLQGKVKITDIRNRMIKEWGDRETVRRMVQMGTKTMENFGFIKNVSSVREIIFEMVMPKRKTVNVDLTLWFTEAVIRAGGAEMMVYEETGRQYYIFPFELEVSLPEIYKSDRLFVVKEGLDQVMVGVR